MKDSLIRDKILKVAADLFYTQGYNLTGINQIIKESGIAKGSLYNHFDSKKSVLLAILEQVDIHLFAEVEEFLAPYTDAREKLLALVDYRLLRQKKTYFGGCQFVKIANEISTDEEEDVMTIVRSNKMAFKNLIKGLVQQIEQPKLLSDDLLTETIYLLLEGSSLNGAIHKSPQSMLKTKKIIETLL